MAFRFNSEGMVRAYLQAIFVLRTWKDERLAEFNALFQGTSPIDAFICFKTESLVLGSMLE